MPVDKFGRTNTASVERIVSAGVTLSQANNTFLKRDGTIGMDGNLDMNGHCITGLTTANVSGVGMDEALSRGQVINLLTNHDDSPTEDNHLTNKKYVDERTAVGPAVSAYKTNPQAINAKTRTKVNFDSVRFKTDGVDSTPSRLTRFTPGKAGCYIVSVYIEFQNTNNTAFGNVFLYKNGTSYMQIAGGGGTGGSYNNSSGSGIVFVTSTDYLEIFAFSNIATSVIARDFSVAFLRS